MPFKSAATFTYPPRLVVSIEGTPKTGKTHFLFKCPPPVYLFNLDHGLEGMMTPDKFDLDQVWIDDFCLSKAASLTATHAVEKAKAVATQFMADWRERVQEHTRITLCLDTASEFWQLFRLADLGKLDQVPPMRYARVNRIWRGLMNEIYQTPHNLILVHRVKDLYVNNEHVPGKTERDGFKETDYIVQVSVEMWRRDREKEQGKPQRPPLFGFTVRQCRQRPSLTGMEFKGKKATFEALALEVFPQSSPGDWT